MTTLRIFAASPSDVARERAKVEAVASLLKPLADALGIVLDVVDWRSVVPDMGRPEQVILDQLKPTGWDVFIGLLWHRFGTPPGSKDAHTQEAYLSGTEEEFQTAYRLWKQYRKPRIMMYRCTRAILPEDLEPDQFSRVRRFFTQFHAVQADHPGLFQSFDSIEAFERLLLKDLQRVLLEYGEQITGRPVAPEVVQAYVPKIPDNLPRRLPFFGRDSEMSIVLRALSPEDRTWGVLVDGLGGNGKTALALEAAHRCKERSLFDAFIFVSAKQNILAPIGVRQLSPSARTVDAFLNETAQVLGQPRIAQLASPAKHGELVNALRSTRTLLIYDNLETLTKEDQELIADFLRGLPQNCKAIITSRRRGGEGAVWLRVEKLEWEAARAIIQDQSARSADLATKLHAVAEKRWHELYDETSGSPLALVHILGLMRVRAALSFDRALEMLRGRGVPDLQEFVFSEARRELTDNDQTALHALSFFASSASFQAWQEVAALSRNALDATIDRLSALALVDVLSGQERFALHPLTRALARKDLLAEEALARVIGGRFAEYWIAYAQRYGPFGKQAYESYENLEAEWSNLETAADLLCETATVSEGTASHRESAKKFNRFARALAHFLFLSGRWDEQVRFNASGYELMLSASDSVAAGYRANHVAWIHLERGNIDEAQRWVERCSEAWSRSSTRGHLATVTHLRGLVARESHDYDLAERLFEDALAIYRELAADNDVSRVLNSLGNLNQARKACDAAEGYFRQALEIDERRDDKGGMATALCNLGEIALERQRWEQARECGNRALPLAREVRRRDLIAGIAYVLARAHVAEGRPDLALPLAQETEDTYKLLRHPELPNVRTLRETLEST